MRLTSTTMAAGCSRGVVSHQHVIECVIECDDGMVSAVVVRRVPALACAVCEQTYYEPGVTDTIVQLLQTVEVAAGRATAVGYPRTD